MKKIIALGIIALSFVACNDDDGEIDPIVGKWFAESIIINGNTIAYEGHASCAKDYLQLNNFNTFVIGDYYDEDSQAKTTPVPPCPVNIYYGSYSITDNNLKIHGSSFFQGGTIIEKTSNKLQLRRFVDVDGDGTSDEIIEIFVK